MSDTNIDKFNDLAGKIFAELYEHFPIPYDLVAKNWRRPPSPLKATTCACWSCPQATPIFLMPPSAGSLAPAT